MTILQDTRNKPKQNRNIRQQLQQLGYTIVRTKVYCGDYTFPANQKICVDTKQDLLQVASNVVQDHQRFRRECVRAQEAGIQLCVLVQQDDITSVSDVIAKWKNPRRFYKKKGARPPISGKQLGKIMLTMTGKYGVQWAFCSRDNVGKSILALLRGGSI